MGNTPQSAVTKQLTPDRTVFWRLEGSLLNLSAVHPVAFFTWNAQSFLGRWARRWALTVSAVVRPFLYATNRVFATRVLHMLLRGVSRDRLDLLGEEYFDYYLKPRLDPRGVQALKDFIAANGTENLVLVSQALDHVARPLAAHLGVKHLLANRLDFRDGMATGRLIHPVVRPRGGLARLHRLRPDGRLSIDRLLRALGSTVKQDDIFPAIAPTRRQHSRPIRQVVSFDSRPTEPLPVRQTLAGKHVMLIGVTGFIGKVWLANLLTHIPDVGRVYLVIRRQKSNTAQRRFEKIVEESPVFDGLHERYGEDLPQFISDRVEVIDGDVTRPGMGLDAETRGRLARRLDLIINSSGLTDFNPDLRDALATNTVAPLNVLEFVRESDHATLLHLSTCYVVGAQDGRVIEQVKRDYTPAGVPGFSAEQELRNLHQLIRDAESYAESAEMTAEFEKQAREKGTGLSAAALENQVRKNRYRWLRTHLTELGMRRARELGWPNTYTLTKSLAESLIEARGADLPVAIVRPSIVESSTGEPFTGWNEGVNTSAPLSYLLGTYFRQLPSNERKRLDVIPVDLVCRGMMLIAAALVQRTHDRLYQLATSATNPCDMGRCIELTCLAHRKHYRAQETMEALLRYRFDTIAVSKKRYERLSAPGQKKLVQAIRIAAKPLPLKKTPLARTERKLEGLQKLIELYEPFILHNDHMFEAQNVALLSARLPADEREVFGYDDTAIDWWEYWINIHIPALRRWSYPLIEGRPAEVRAGRSFRMPEQRVAAGAVERSSQSTRGPEAAWPSS